MARRSKQAAREARRAFEAALAEGHTYREASQIAGVTERTGRRWRAVPGTRRPAESGVRPVYGTPFEGRTSDLTALGHRFATGARLVTLLGPPGVGKTRLASRWMDTPASVGFKQRVFCDLRRVTSVTDLEAELARHLDAQLTEADGSPSIAALLAAQPSCLLVLDNFEQLAEQAAAAVATWLEQAPKLAILVTSRQRLRLRAEVVHELLPLSLPTTDANEDDIWKSEAVRLFWDRAKAAEPSLSRSSVAASDLAAIAHHVDGIPLALELAAARLRTRRVAELRREIAESALVLESPWRDGDPCHVTLGRAIEQSWELLSPAERSGLAQASVFRNGFSLAAAEAVITLPEGAKVAEVLASLRDASLVHVSDAEGGPRRWDLFEAIREYAGNRLVEDGETKATEARHARHFLEQGERWATEVPTERGTEARRTLDAELENLRGAFDWLLAHSEDNRGVRMALVIQDALMPGLPVAAIHIANRALTYEAREMDTNAIAAQVMLRVRRATALRETGGSEQARVDLDDARSLLEATAHQVPARELSRLQGEIALTQGWVELFRGDGNNARMQLEAAVDCAARAEDRHLEGRARSALGEVLAEVFADLAAFEHHDEAVCALTEVGDAEAISRAESARAIQQLFYRRGDPADVFRPWATTRPNRRLSERGYAYFFLACEAFDRGDLEEALARYRQARDLAARAGHRRLLGVSKGCTAIVLDRRGRALDRVTDLLEKARAIFSEDSDRRYEALMGFLLAGVKAREGNLSAATRLLEDGKGLLASTDDLRFQWLAELQRGQLDLAHAKLALSSHEPEAAMDHVRSAERRCAVAENEPLPTAPHSLPLTACCIEARFCLPLLRRELEAVYGAQRTLHVACDGSWVRNGPHPRSPIADGPVIRRLLLELVAQRQQAPGEPLSTADLVSRCWPGERMQLPAGYRRVQDLVRRLRSSGLGDVLLTGADGGYLLDPAVPVSLSTP